MLVEGSQLRRVIALALAAVALAAAVVVAAVPAAHAARRSSRAASANPFVGVVSDETFAAIGSGNRSYLGNIRRTGVGLLRQKFDWQFLTYHQPAGQLNWRFLDRFITATSKLGITVMPVLLDPPPGITTAPARHAMRGIYPPRDLGAVGDFGAALAARYGSTGSFWAQHPRVRRLPITAWQIWNEPNVPYYWRPRPNAAAFVQMLRLASQKIKAVDPQAEIVTAGLPDSHIRGSVPLFSYIRQMFHAGAAGAFDTLAVNAYAPTGGGVVRLVSRIRSMVNRLGGGAAGLRVTEFGWADHGPEKRPGRFTAGRRQGVYTYDAIRGLWRARGRLKLRGIVYYDWRDQPVYAGGKNFWGLHTGLLTLNGHAKPAMRWFKRAVSSLR